MAKTNEMILHRGTGVERSMPYRVMVVDDSAFMRRIVSDLIEQDPAFHVQGTAKNGREAVELIAEMEPDLVTMDVEMPEMNGLEALKLIMERSPLPVIMLSGINEQGMRETIMALELGAFDFIRKPSASTSSHDIDQVGVQLREQIRAAMIAKERRAARMAALASITQELLPPVNLSPSGHPSEKRRTSSAQKPRSLEASVRAVKRELAGEELKVKPALDHPGLHQTSTKQESSGGAIKPKKRPSASNTVGAGKEVVNPVKPSKAAKFNDPPADNKPSKQIADQPAVLAAELEHAARERERSSAKTLRTDFTELVAIGTSTGGPKALKAVLEKLPADFPAPIVIVQHMPPNFTKSLAQRLNSLSDLTVVEAEEGMKLQAGVAYIAPGGYHLNVVQGPDGDYLLALTKQEPRHGHRPSVDVLYDSLLPLRSLNRHVVLLTGMGSDGAKSMKRLYDAGVSSTIAESEETCVVYGMPRSAVELGCVNEVLPLQEIGPKLAQVVK